MSLAVDARNLLLLRSPDAIVSLAEAAQDPKLSVGALGPSSLSLGLLAYELSLG